MIAVEKIIRYYQLFLRFYVLNLCKLIARFGYQLDEPWGFSGDHQQMRWCLLFWLNSVNCEPIGH